ncbi:triphosphoribosyl-dephospho-CoA synthase [Rahnella sp. BIGb0603]|jgi:triphosphoribosyl-dephospho-CoA synthase|uniref:triphosphoribosyl-dephospho-CoA synthase CitG n=1 Tax=Rahnella TaxID=34037 RepID=UPI002167C204|nr:MULTISPECIES: triphosphoribosyl-dephospho-CoA synthase CitG [Rahnella]MCS3424899.1 triphosphoribosyl-dephospho-CoA synthase [Rahnella sp. BIGb0603]MDF1894858.1 triphosphoribosyl-dephospho-CoA synthase CitG [Rahnella contaminans]
MAGIALIEPQVCTDIATLAADALRQEVWLTPKPGLVDSANNGSHSDMDLPMFLRSIGAITPWLHQFYRLGQQDTAQPATAMLMRIRPAGLACEQAMFGATNGINTHKGGIFSLGILCTAAGRISARQQLLTRTALCAEVAALTQGLVERELQHCRQPVTAGERLFQAHGMTGARGEVQSGFVTLRRHVLPYWQTETQPERRGLNALLRLMAFNPDTNLVSRGGLSGLHFVQDYARKLLKSGWQKEDLQEMDQALISRHLSPGGSADLLAIATVLMAFPQ